MASVHKCIESTLSVANNELKYKAEIVKNFGDLPQIECMPFQLNQVFLNLFVNAAKPLPLTAPSPFRQAPRRMASS